MTPQEYEWQHEQAEIAYERDQIDVHEFRKRLRGLRVSDAGIDLLIRDLDHLKATHPHS